MTAHLLDTPLPRPHVAGPDYRGRHRGAGRSVAPGSLVNEPGSTVPSSVIRHVDPVTVLVRHIGTQDDHPVPLRNLTAFADGRSVMVGADFGDST